MAQQSTPAKSWISSTQAVEDTAYSLSKISNHFISPQLLLFTYMSSQYPT